ncbi:MAG: Ig domain-containing protein, partial [Firmicutes bacterium]|nr:Ig domain-containing protein [Bacillota bacterium]
VSTPVSYTVENVGALTLSYPTPQTFAPNTPISSQLPTLGNATPGLLTTYDVTSGSLPAGLTLNADGTITGTPTTPGTYNFTVTATNGSRTVSTPVSYTVENVGALTLSYPTPQTFVPNTAISSQLPTLGNATPGLPTTYAVTSGSLPAGLTLNADGTITGTPTTPGTYNFTVTATNGSRTATSNVQYVVTAAPTALNYTSPVDGTATVGIASNNPNPSGGTPTSYTVTGGSLPPGLTLNPTTGVISGTPTTPGDYTVTIQGSNAAGSTSQTVTYHVAAYPTASLTANPSVIPVNQAPALTALFTGALNGTAVISGGNLTSPMTVGTGTSIPAPAEAAPTVQTYTLTVTSPQGIIVTSTVTVQWVPVPSDIWTVTVHQDGTGSPYQPDPGHPLDGQIRIDVPNQGTSICGDSVLTVNRETALPGTLPASARNYSQTFNIASNQSYPFRVPITITLAYDPNGASPSLTAADLPVPFYWDANYGQWVAAGLKSVNTVAHTVSFTTLSPGRYVVLGIPGLTSVNQALDFLSARDDWRQLNPSIYDLPGGASLGMSSFAAWYQPFRKPTNGNVGLYNIFPNLTDANAASLISRLANGTQDNWKALWNQMGYALTDRQTGLALLTGLIISQQPQVFLMADQRSASPSTSLATAVYGFDNTTTPKRFKVMDTNYPGMSLTIAWDPSTGAFSAYDRAAGYAPAITQYAFEGQTSIHRLADYDRVFSGAQSGFPTGTYAVLSVTDVAGVSSPDLSQPIVVSSSANVTVTGTVTNGDAAATHIYWSQNGNAPRTAVPLTPVDATTSTFTFTIPQLSDPYNTTIAIETASNPCDPTFAHSGYREFTVKQIGLAPWFPNICFESGNSSPWTLEQGSNNAKLYPAAPTFGASGVTNYNITWNPASVDSAIVTPGSDANLPAIHQVLDGSYAFRINNSASGAHVSRMYQTLTVPGTIAMPKLIFYWAAVMQDPGHSPAEQPFVDILVQDLSNPATPLYYQHFYAGSPTYPGWLTGSSGGWKGIPWQKVTLNLGPPPVLGGVPQDRSIRIMGVAADCTQTGHGGYVYIDGTNCQ